MERCALFQIFVLIGLFTKLGVAVEPSSNDEAPNCPMGYGLWNGLCYVCSQNPDIQNCKAAQTGAAVKSLAENYTQKKSLNEMSCPQGSIFTNGQCRKLICPLGEFINGRCLQITCPAGMVWRDHSCKEPEYITTIIEIENVFRTNVHERHGNVTQQDTGSVENMPDMTTTSPALDETTKSTTTTTTSTTTSTTTTSRPPAPIIRPKCCKVHSPRLCKIYQRKWVCFTQRREFCDWNVCEYPMMYLKTPQIVFEENLLVMPPHPPLKACRERGCDDSDTLDCSGCAKGEKETCSPYCYYYYCPEDNCGYMNLQDFCKLYPDHPFGCSRDVGCIWGWCGSKKNQN